MRRLGYRAAGHRVLLYVSAGAAACLIASCAFVLNFDELQAGDPGTDAAAGAAGDGAGGTGGTGGSSAGSGGSSGACPASCDDMNPCTTDACDPDTAKCKNDLTKGFVPDGFQQSIQADQMHRATIAAAGNEFFIAAFETTNGQNEVTLFSVTTDEDKLTERVKVSKIGLFGTQEVRSAPAMIADTSSGVLATHAFIAFADANPALTAVWHVVFDSRFALLGAQYGQLGVADYDATAKKRRPVALQVGTGVMGAWIRQDGTIGAGALGVTPVTLGGPGVKATQITPVAAQNTFGVLWTGGAIAQNQGVYAQLIGQPYSTLTDCEARPGVYLSATSVSVGISGLWVTSWTKAGANFLSTNGNFLACGAAQCLAASNCSKPADEGQRNPEYAILRRPGDPVGVVFMAAAGPRIRASTAGGVEAALSLSLQRLDFGPTPLDSEPMVESLGTLDVAVMPATAPTYAGPDWPALALLAPDRILLAYIQPALSGGEELQVSRYRICY